MFEEVFQELGRATGEGVRVAVVDSGVQADHTWVGRRLRATYKVAVQGPGYVVMPCPPEDVFGHGTAVAGQIRRFAPMAELISVQVLGGNLKTNSQCLLTALRWLTTQDVHIVNLSLSTMSEELALRMSHAVDDLYARRIACVCARGYHKTGKAFPTDFSGTIGVSYTKLPQGRVEHRSMDNVDFNASGIAVKVAWNDHGTREVEGSSFACPLVTGLAARMLSIRPNLTPYELKTLLKAFAERQAEGWWEDWMQRVDQDPVHLEASS